MDRKPDSGATPPRPREPSRPAVGRDVSKVGAELHASLEARRELGPEYEAPLVEGFLERLDQAIDARVDARMEQHRSARPPATSGVDRGQLALGIVTTALGVPLTGIATQFHEASIIAFLVIWAGIVLVNLTAALSRRR